MRLMLGGISGHKDIARDTGVLDAAGRLYRGGGRCRSGLHCRGRPNQPRQGTAEIRARPPRFRNVSRQGRSGARTKARPRGNRNTWRHARRPIVSPTWAFIRRSRKAASMWAWLFRWGGSPVPRCAALRRSPASSATAMCASRCGRTCWCPASPQSALASLRQGSLCSGFPPRRVRSAQALSPAPARPVASSRTPTPRSTRWSLPSTWKRDSHWTRRSTSISQGAPTPAPSTISATSA